MRISVVKYVNVQKGVIFFPVLSIDQVSNSGLKFLLDLLFLGLSKTI
jgi:hypothetical protein